ncbi:hypothetical protein EDD22DRAFT_960811 [Suillus occidentalis]|nr:hypothetical protein EDD22DRAFT_960811 [Suillus occidentalis]
MQLGQSALLAIAMNYVNLKAGMDEGGGNGEGHEVDNDERVDVDFADNELEGEEEETEDEEEESDDELQDDDLGEEVWEEDDELSF